MAADPPDGPDQRRRLDVRGVGGEGQLLHADRVALPLSPAYQALAAKVDAFVERVSARHAADLACRPGCATCCHDRLTVTTVEAAAIVAWAEQQPPAARASLAAAAAAAPSDRCAALAEDDRCRIYPARPLVCRSHGVPIRLHERGLPVVTACALNFTARGPAAADPDCILDQTLVSTTLGVIDRTAGGADRRHDLAALLCELAP